MTNNAMLSRMYKVRKKDTDEQIFITIDELLSDKQLVEPIEYTGLQDKNNEAIYANHIIKTCFGDVTPIRWHRGAFDVRVKDRDGKTYNELLGNIMPDNMEIVGIMPEDKKMINV